jgi:hypothetical protein
MRRAAKHAEHVAVRGTAEPAAESRTDEYMESFTRRGGVSWLAHGSPPMSTSRRGRWEEVGGGQHAECLSFLLLPTLDFSMGILMDFVL